MFEHPVSNGRALLDVLNGKKPWRRPVWMMRQAGRYLPEYRQVRAQAGSFLDLCYSPELATEVTLQPLRRFDLDAAILFADILLLPQALGQPLEFRQNEGPVLEAISGVDGVSGLGKGNYLSRLEPVIETVARLSEKLPGHIGLIGFCGAPWTVATYMVEGGTSPDRAKTRIAAHRDSDWFNGLIDLIVEGSIEYLCAQAGAGAQVLQIFDTWAGDLPDGLCERYCFEPIRRIVDGVVKKYPDVPVIGFARGVGSRQLDFAKATGVKAIGVEWSYPVKDAAEVLQQHVVVQGNLDPLALLSDKQAIEVAVRNLVSQMDPSRHIMNLGHGIKPETPIENVHAMIDTVRGSDGSL